jgi:hypothetical protein
MINITDKEQKLLALALNESAAEGEITNAAVMFFRSLRERGVKADTVNQSQVARATPFPHFSYRVWSSAGGGTWTQTTSTTKPAGTP